ncbi:HD-GYP domain-containing protein [Halobacillus litoralis]|uniref:HD-GYP domain-containing protein n=1 Tax=Halobacillus litoralis TaxID=45668 RepID=UPI001CFF4E4D|nr:HD-GYP domain-containing protein [Halobacillus litoralis]
MKVLSSQLEPGCLLMKDVMGRTSRPIIPKNTILQPLHINLLMKFEIEHVEIANRKLNGSLINQSNTIQAEETTDRDQSKPLQSFHHEYLEAVQTYKKWFTSWQGGAPIDMAEVRKWFVPLLEKVVDSKEDVFYLYHFSSGEDYIYHHSVSMGLLSGYLAYLMGYEYGDWVQIGLAGILSDSGMSKLPTRIPWKQGALTESEFEQVKNHPTYAYRQVEKISSLSSHAKLAILQHHERLDGTGYPLGLKQEKIHPFSQIIAVSDMYHAMTSERMYRRKKSPYKVLEEILQEQFGRYDHRVISAIVKEMANFSTGTNIRLSDNRRAEVLFAENHHPTRPMIRLEDSGEIMHLKEHLHLHIEEVYD